MSYDIKHVYKDPQEGSDIFVVAYFKDGRGGSRWVMAKSNEEAINIVTSETEQLMRWNLQSYYDHGEMIRASDGEYVRYDLIEQYLPEHLKRK